MGEHDLSEIAQLKDCDRQNSSSYRKNAIAPSMDEHDLSAIALSKDCYRPTQQP
jgi:hypothetical protein